MSKNENRLDPLGTEDIEMGSTDRLITVLKQLEEADELSGDIRQNSELWDGVTVEKLLGALVEADGMLASYQLEKQNWYDDKAAPYLRQEEY